MSPEAEKGTQHPCHGSPSALSLATLTLQCTHIPKPARYAAPLNPACQIRETGVCFKKRQNSESEAAVAPGRELFIRNETTKWGGSFLHKFGPNN